MLTKMRPREKKIDILTSKSKGFMGCSGLETDSFISILRISMAYCVKSWRCSTHQENRDNLFFGHRIVELGDSILLNRVVQPQIV